LHRRSCSRFRLQVATGDSDGALALLDRIIAKEPANHEALPGKG
jgi:hypothetical protein